MAASDYFKVAASNIRRAIEFKKSEINDIRSQLEQKKSQHNQEVTKKDAEAKLLQLALSAMVNQPGQPNKDRETKTRLLHEIAEQITKTQHGMTDQEKQAADQIKSIEGELSGLDQLASSLESRN